MCLYESVCVYMCMCVSVCVCVYVFLFFFSPSHGFWRTNLGQKNGSVSPFNY